MKQLLKLSMLIGFTSIVGFTGYKAGTQGVSTMQLVDFASAKAKVILGREPEPMTEPAVTAEGMRAEDGGAFVAVYGDGEVGVNDTMRAKEKTGSGEPRILYYRNPMGLPDTSTTPKKDSMGMDYLPVYAGDSDDGSTVKVAGGKLQRTGVKTELASKSVITRPVTVPGTVVLDERSVSVVSTRTEVFVEQVSDVTSGSRIQKGQPLFKYFGKEIAAAGALYAADLKIAGGRKGAEGSLQRLRNLDVPAEMINEIEQTGKVPISVTLMAPRSGVVMERMAVDGMMAAAGETLFKIADTSTVWVIANVPEFELSSIKAGAMARVRIRSLPQREFSGEVDTIYPEIQGQTRTARVRIQIPNPDGLLLPNMYADVSIATGNAVPVITVPASAVIDSGDRQVVIIDKGEGSFEPRPVKLGMRGDGMIEIIEGVAEGDRVVVSANFLIDAESNLKAALSALIPAETSK